MKICAQSCIKRVQLKISRQYVYLSTISLFHAIGSNTPSVSEVNLHSSGVYLTICKIKYALCNRKPFVSIATHIMFTLSLNCPPFAAFGGVYRSTLSSVGWQCLTRPLFLRTGPDAPSHRSPNPRDIPQQKLRKNTCLMKHANRQKASFSSG